MRLSVVIPAYNCAGTIGATLDSLLAQTFFDFEALVINDGSTDRTSELLAAYAARDARVHVITVENAGPARARNRGIEAAAGEYLCFLDSDDLLLPDAYERLISLADEHALDCVVCGYRMEKLGRAPSVREFRFPSFVAQSPEEFRDRASGLIRAHLMYVVWNKCWRVSFLQEQGLRFEDYKSGEDRLFNFQALPLYHRFGCVGEPLYRYLIRGSGSLVNRYIPNRLESALACHRALLAAYGEMGLFAGERAGAERAAVEFQFVKLALSCLSQLYAPDCPLTRWEKRAAIRATLALPELREAASRADRSFGYSALVNGVLRSGSVSLTAGMAGAIWLLQAKLHPWYLKLKHRS